MVFYKLCNGALKFIMHSRNMKNKKKFQAQNIHGHEIHIQNHI